jgi:hypothetical protein
MTKEECYNTCKTGDEYTAQMINRGKNTINGKIYISKQENRVYLCHNDRGYDGSSAPDKQGYKYSWSWDGNVENFKIIPNEDTQAVVSQNPVIINNYAIY